MPTTSKKKSRACFLLSWKGKLGRSLGVLTWAFNHEGRGNARRQVLDMETHTPSWCAPLTRRERAFGSHRLEGKTRVQPADNRECVRVCLCACAPVHARACIPIHVCTRDCVCVRMCVCACAYLCMCALCMCVHVRLCVCTCACVYLCTCVHVHVFSCYDLWQELK